MTLRTSRRSSPEDLVDPVGDERFGDRHHHLARTHVQRQDAESAGVLDRHHVGDLGEIHLQRVDVDMIEARASGCPARQRFQIERASALRGRLQLAVSQGDQRGRVGARQPRILRGRLRVGLRDETVGHERIEQFDQVEADGAARPICGTRCWMRAFMVMARYQRDRQARAAGG
jgi:hypothetical protein